jgi:hypothetical protein
MGRLRVDDAYEAYVSRKRAAEDAAERDRAAKRRPKTDEEAQIPRWDMREHFGDSLSGITVRSDGGYEIRGPLCSDDLHTFVVHLSPHAVSPSGDRGNGLASGVCTGLGAVALGIPFVGWVIAFLFWGLAALFGRRADRKRLAPKKRLQEAEQAMDHPWRWWLARVGPDPWSNVVVDRYQDALNLGVHHPRKDAAGAWLITQVEKSLPDAVSSAERVLQAFTY